MWTILTHILCVMAGGIVGVTAMCLMVTAKEADKHKEEKPERRTDE